MKPPRPATLAKYGLSAIEWGRMYEEQNGKCGVCWKGDRRLVIDHEHVKGWRKLPPWERAKYVRGLLCWTCNYYHLARGMDLPRAKQLVLYLADYALERRQRELGEEV